MDSLAREKETRLSIEKSQVSLLEELGKSQAELQGANQRVIKKQILFAFVKLPISLPFSPQYSLI